MPIAKTTKIIKKKEKENEVDIDPNEMMRSGVHLGHQTSKLHPRMEEFVLGIRNTVHVLDLEKTANCLEVALKFISELTKEGKSLLLVGTKTPLRNLVKETAQECNLSYVAERWLGGTFTNFEVVAKRAKYFKDLQKQKDEGELSKYTKKERIKIAKELEDLSKKFKGIENMEKIPDAVFICDIVRDKLCLKEARMKGIKTVAIVDTNADPALVDYPIPANDDAISSVKYILEKVKDTILKAKK